MTQVYIHEICQVRSGCLGTLRDAVADTFMPLAAKHGLKKVGFWETAPSQGWWPETVELWELESFPAYLAYLEQSRTDADLIEWQAQKGELIDQSSAELCRRGRRTADAEAARAFGKHKLWLHEMVETKPSRQDDYVRSVEEFLMERIIDPIGRDILGNFIPVFNNRLVINIWPHGDDIPTSTMGRYWPGETEYTGDALLNMNIWMTLGPEVRLGWEDRFLVPVEL